MRLTGQISTDLSDASASVLDTRRAQWSPQILDAYGLGGLEHLLPELQRGGDAAAIGMGVLIPDRLAPVAGSFNTNGVTTTRDDVDPRWQSRLSIQPDLWIAMSTSPTASPALDWLLGLLGVTDSAQRGALFAEAADLNPQHDVPVVLPFLYSSPLGADGSAVHGWHSRAHILRGMFEGIVLMHYWHTSALAERFHWDKTIVLGGGSSHSELYVQLVANALRASIQVVHNEEAGAFGAAALAAVSQGMFPSIQAAQERIVRARVVEPTTESASYWQDVTAALGGLGSALDPWWAWQRNAQGGELA